MADENLLLIAVKLAGTAKAGAELQTLQGEIKATGDEAALAGKKSKSLAFNAGLLGTGLGKLWHYGKMGALGLAGVGIAAGIAGANFEQQMASVHAVTNANAMDMKALSDAALHEATVTRFSASQAAEGMYRLGRAGFNAGQVLQAIPGTLNLAHASSIDMATAATIQAESLRAFGLKASQAGMVADVLAKATQGGAMSMQDLGTAMKYFGAVAFGTGQKLPQMVGLLKAMALHAVRGSQAGTTLRQALSRLVNPQKQTAKGLQLMNIEAHDLYNSRGLKSLPVILDTMHKKMLLLDPVSRKTAISQTFGMHALGGMMAIFNQGPAKWKEFIKQMENSGGTAKHMADILNNTLQMRLLRLWHTLEALGIKFFMTFSPKLKGYITAIDDTLGTYVDHWNAVSAILGPGHALVAMVDNLVHAHGKLIAAANFLEKAFKVSWTFVKTIVLPVAIQYGKVLGGALFLALWAIIKVMAFFNRHATAAKFIIGLLITAYINWKIVTLTVTAVTKVAAMWQTILKFRAIAMFVASKAIAVGMKLWAAAQWLVNIAVDAFPAIMIITALILIGYVIYKFRKQILSFLLGALQYAWNWIKRYWPLILIMIGGPVGLAVYEIIRHWHDITYFFTHFGSSMEKVGSTMWNWLTKGFDAAKKWIIDELNSLFNMIHDNWPDVPGLPGPAFGRNPFGGGGGGGGGAQTLVTGGAGALGFVNRYAGANPLAASPAYVQSPANTSRGFLAPRVVDPITPNPDNPLFQHEAPWVHAQFMVDNKVLVDAVAKGKSDNRARRGG